MGGQDLREQLLACHEDEAGCLRLLRKLYAQIRTDAGGFARGYGEKRALAARPDDSGALTERTLANLDLLRTAMGHLSIHTVPGPRNSRLSVASVSRAAPVMRAEYWRHSPTGRNSAWARVRPALCRRAWTMRAAPSARSQQERVPDSPRSM